MAARRLVASFPARLTCNVNAQCRTLLINWTGSSRPPSQTASSPPLRKCISATRRKKTTRKPAPRVLSCNSRVPLCHCRRTRSRLLTKNQSPFRSSTPQAPPSRAIISAVERAFSPSNRSAPSRRLPRRVSMPKTGTPRKSGSPQTAWSTPPRCSPLHLVRPTERHPEPFRSGRAD